ncbi:hypothetical protein SteCoe_27195 [Stentor coeruleus]|uniref:Uncharacterized protein n=1 Tax=Stentor coeruleus TaxID=5963 RepID=A0A1R2BB44_9CILI|nr:hypothetical protein SteCoe_27195 [Stentor coeruleus]
MNEEIIKLRKELEEAENELDKVRKEYREKEENNTQLIAKHKSKWEVKHCKLIKDIRSIQETYEKEKKKWQDQMLIQSETLIDLKQRTAKEEENERKFLMQIDAELLAVAGRAQMRSNDNSISVEGDTLFDGISSEIPEETNQILHAIFKSREIIRTLLEKTMQPLITIPPLPQVHTPTFDIPEISKSLTESYRDTSLYSKILINDDILNSLSMSEREAVVYSLINSGAGPEEKREVQLEDLLNLTGAEEKLVLSSGRFEDLSSIIEEESGVDSVKENMGLTFSLPDVKVNELSSSRVKNIPADEFSSISSNTHRSKHTENLYSDIEVPNHDTNELDNALVHEHYSVEEQSEESLNELKRDCKEFLKGK